MPEAEARATLDAIYLPPAAHGDVYRATLRRPMPRIIAIIDGNFRHLAAVRHKEILWALSQGIHVFGAASIGALRAAELTRFGMVGVGEIFEQYCSGELEDDDEVAVDHGPVELGYLPLNEAMVDIRATLASARRQQIIDQSAEARLLTTTKGLFYPGRTYEALLETQSSGGAERRLRQWLPSGRLSQKRKDALALLARIKLFAASEPPPFAPAFRFERTEAWEADVAFAMSSGEFSDEGVPRKDLLDELRLDPEMARRVYDQAFGLALAQREAARSHVKTTEEEVAEFRKAWLAERKLDDPDVFGRWRQENHMDTSAFTEFITTRAIEAKLRRMAGDLMEGCITDILRAQNHYVPLANRARSKRRLLDESGTGALSMRDSARSAEELLAWFCQVRLGRPLPDDLEAFAGELAYASVSELCQALLRERLYLQLTNGEKVNTDPQ